MKITITALIKSIGPVEPTKKGDAYSQKVVLEQPERKDEFNRTTQRQQIFQVEIYDKERTARFLDAASVNQVRTFNLWLKGEVSERDGKPPVYFLKLKVL